MQLLAYRVLAEPQRKGKKVGGERWPRNRKGGSVCKQVTEAGHLPDTAVLSDGSLRRVRSAALLLSMLGWACCH